MKNRFTVIVSCVVILVAFLFCTPKPFSKVVAEVMPRDSAVKVYALETTLDCISYGNGKIVDTTISNLPKTLLAVKGLLGISVSVADGEFDYYVQAFHLESEVYICANVQTVCGFDKFVSGRVVIDGKPVNVQVACSNGVVTVGSPLILGSY